MAVDFPNAPTDGQLHTEEDTTWRWDATTGCWLIGSVGPAVEIVGGDVGAGWTVWGDALIQWGQATTNGSGQVSVVLPEAYTAAGDYKVVSSGSDVATASINVGTTTQTASGFDIFAVNSADVGVAEPVDWIAIGEAPDALKKAKMVGGGSAGTPDAQRALTNIGEFYGATAWANYIHSPAYGGIGDQWDIMKMDAGDLMEEVLIDTQSRLRATNYDTNPSGPFFTSVGVQARIYYYDGADWQAVGTNFIELATDQSGVSIVTFDYAAISKALLTQDHIRSDVGDRWTLRVQFSPIYATGRVEHVWTQAFWQQFRRAY